MQWKVERLGVYDIRSANETVITLQPSHNCAKPAKYDRTLFLPRNMTTSQPSPKYQALHPEEGPSCS